MRVPPAEMGPGACTGAGIPGPPTPRFPGPAGVAPGVPVTPPRGGSPCGEGVGWDHGALG
ncbi:hypothetical protein KVA01_09100 [Kocuria varians]|uniref:Uncharacterized protein n=1 Tax=Kocuria varians TaxID=1272 RepID=A0A4Y4D0P6_KOCVA|nr:hypothetical protein KVA01_09100 [Kocuria varians]